MSDEYHRMIEALNQVISEGALEKALWGGGEPPFQQADGTLITGGLHISPGSHPTPCDGCPRTIRDLQQEQARWSAHNFGHLQSDYNHPFKGMVEELGELSHALLKQEQGIRGTYEEHEAKAKDALADIFVFMLDLATKKGWDLQEVVFEVWDEVKKRDWKRFPKNGLTE